MRDSLRTIALIGNPNCGKTTLFNGLTGGNHRIGNWPGVTVERKEGTLRMSEPGFFLADPFVGQGEVLDAGHTVRPNEQRLPWSDRPTTIVDLPGIYSLSAMSEDERIARDFVLYESIDLIVNILDSSNLERNLYLTLQLIELGKPLVVVLNMIDIAARKNIEIDVQNLSQMLGVEVIAVQGTKRKDIRSLATLIGGRLGLHFMPPRVPYRAAIEEWIEDPSTHDAVIRAGILRSLPSETAERPGTERWAALQVLENPALFSEFSDGSADSDAVSSLGAGRDRIAKSQADDPDILVAEDKYRFIEEICRRVMKKGVTRESVSDRIDRIVLSRVLGIPIFLLVMYLVFWFTISVGGAFIDFFDILGGALFVDGFGTLLWNIGAPPWLIGILASGIGSGLQTVATFIPIIFTMFFALTLLEDSGYMARAAFVVDRFMQVIGLPGKAFIPMIVGFGCTVPGILGTRTLESTKDRFTTIFMTPFMSCGARLPVYTLFILALFPRSSGFVLFSIYLAGIVLAVLTGLLLKLTVFRGASSHFIMELPPYHPPRVWFTIRNAGTRVRSFIVRAGVVIAVAVSILTLMNAVHVSSPQGLRFSGPGEEERQDDSILALVSRAVSPAFVPLGVTEENWPAVVGLVTGLFAKETIVGTLNSLYAHREALSDTASTASAVTDGAGFDFGAVLLEALATIPANLADVFTSLGGPLELSMLDSPDDETVATSVRVRTMFTPRQGYAYLLFVLIYTPCLAAVGAAIREMGRRWGLGLSVYLMVLAWSVSTLFYQIAEGGSAGWILAALSVLLAIVFTFAAIGWKQKKFAPAGRYASDGRCHRHGQYRQGTRSPGMRRHGSRRREGKRHRGKTQDR